MYKRQGKGIERALKSLHERNVKVDAQNADGLALVVADKDRRRFEQLTVGGFSEVRLAVVYIEMCIRDRVQALKIKVPPLSTVMDSMWVLISL